MDAHLRVRVCVYIYIHIYRSIILSSTLRSFVPPELPNFPFRRLSPHVDIYLLINSDLSSRLPGLP